jgi:hypothetical protein
MITIRVAGYTWNNAKISDVFNILLSTSGMRYALFYCDRAEITARLPENMSGVLSRVSARELAGKEDWSDVINRVHHEIYDMLVKITKQMEKEMPAGIE